MLGRRRLQQEAQHDRARFRCSAAPRLVGVLLGLLAPACLAVGDVAAADPPRSAPLRIGTSGDYAPFSLSKPGGGFEGLDIDMARRLGADLGRAVEFVRFAWPDLTEHLAAGDFDLALGGVTMRPERALVGRYSRAYAIVGAVALVRSADADRLDSLGALDRADVRIAVNRGGHLERVARRLFPSAALSPTRDNASLASRVLDGRADAAITDTAEVRRWQQPALSVVGPFTRDHKAFLLRAENADLAVRIDEWLRAREEDGWLDARRVHWLGPTASSGAPAAAREATVALIELRLALMPAVAAAKRTAGLPIEDPAQEARVLDRVRRAAGRQASRVEAVYGLLIELAKQVQRSTPAAEPEASLPRLREAIRRVDEGILRELGQGKSGDAQDWWGALATCLSLPGVREDSLRRLAEVLGGAPLSDSPSF